MRKKMVEGTQDRSNVEADHSDKKKPDYPCFFEVIVADTLESKKLMVPRKFVGYYGDLFSDHVTLILPNGQSWKVGLTKSTSEIYFDDNWSEFVERCSIQERNFLIFRFKCMSTFEVRILDRSGCEIEYPSNLPAGSGNYINAAEIEEEEEEGKKKKRVFNCSKETAVKDGEKKKAVSNDEMSDISSGDSNQEYTADNSSSKQYPCFTVMLREYNFHYTCVYIPALFAEKYMGDAEGARYAKLIVGGDGEKEWSLKVNRRTSGRLSLGSGWAAFRKKNDLKNGDICLFELVDKDVFHVSITRPA